MGLFVIPFPEIDPVALSLGPIDIKWYGLSYVTGLILGWLYVRSLISHRSLWPAETPPFSKERVDDLIIFLAIGTIIGGRLGYVFLYEPQAYLAQPWEILAVWKGGMAFHGALIGCGLAVWAFAVRYNVNAWTGLDLATAAVPVGLIFGRLANFINGELFGRVSDVPWAMVFPQAKYLYPNIEPAPRHPSQLYEAALEGALLFLVLRFLTHNRAALSKPGLVTGAFLVGYGLTRSFAEFFRDPHFYVGPLTAGQVYSVPMVLLGAIIIWRCEQTAVQGRTE